MQGDHVVYKEIVSCEELDCDDEEEEEVQNDTTFVIYIRSLQVKHLRDPFRRQSLSNKPGESANMGCGVLQTCDANAMKSDFECADSSSDESNKAVKKSQPRKEIRPREKMVKWAPPLAREEWKEYVETDSSGSTTSSRVSFKWVTSSCLNSSLMYSPLASTSGNHHISGLPINPQSSKLDEDLQGNAKCQNCISSGQWITTDSEYAVLEL